ncbi:hypothetical protein [Pseudaestuariivita rosea]|uniref:hypothetical protein n=1 Tax=Pseudaestuariivita rosea TaxID=2763263 RepID=UPI001ABB4300|nr:hypothetical protein [Pseudaestuariivita rosea]
MSRGTASKGDKGALIIGGVIVAIIVIFAFVLLSGDRTQSLRRSVIGFDGLHSWLTSQRADSQIFSGGYSFDPDTIGLRIVPLYDTNLRRTRSRALTQEDVLMQEDIRDMPLGELSTKIDAVQTMVVLPKWRRGTQITSVAHPDLMVAADSVERVLNQLGVENPIVGYARNDFGAYPVSVGSTRYMAELYVAQTFTADDCQPYIGDESAMVLAQCQVKLGRDYDSWVLILSDPDLLNNHGLRLGDNAFIARSLLPELAGDLPIMIDYSTDTWAIRRFTSERPERTWGDLMRFFEFPFTLLWIGFLAMFALFIWRASVRYGAPRRLFDDGPSAEKVASIMARSKLLRLSGHDGALLSDYIEVRLNSFATELFGPGLAKQGTSQVQIERFLKRHDPQIATRFMTLTDQIRSLPSDIPGGDAIRYVDDFETLLQQVKNDFR